MRFSERTHWPDSSALSREVDDARRSGRLRWDLTSQNPTQVGLVLPDEGLAEALAQASRATYEPEPFGLFSARTAICAELKAKISVEQLVLTASTSEAYGFLFKLLGDPGANILVPTPTYPLIELIAGLEGLGVRQIPQTYAQGWHLDVDLLAQAGDANTRAIVVVNPNHPTGSFLKRSELSDLWRLCEQRGWALIVDEVFASYAHSGGDLARVTSVGASDAPVLTFTLGGLSKHAVFPQLKLSWMSVQGPPAQLGQALARLELMADCALSVATPIQRALTHVLGLAPSRRKAVQERVHQNRTVLRETLVGSPLSILEAEGGWAAVLQLPLLPGEEPFCREALARGVWVDPGFFYDFTRGSHVVLSLLTETSHLKQGLERLLAP